MMEGKTYTCSAGKHRVTGVVREDGLPVITLQADGEEAAEVPAPLMTLLFGVAGQPSCAYKRESGYGDNHVIVEATSYVTTVLLMGPGMHERLLMGRTAAQRFWSVLRNIYREVVSRGAMGRLEQVSHDPTRKASSSQAQRPVIDVRLFERPSGDARMELETEDTYADVLLSPEGMDRLARAVLSSLTTGTVLDSGEQPNVTESNTADRGRNE